LVQKRAGSAAAPPCPPNNTKTEHYFVQSGEGFSMQNKEPERADPSEYAFGVKCSATVERKTTQWRNIPIHWNVAGAKRLGFPKGNQPLCTKSTDATTKECFGLV
jgi:hypothetical protein